MTNGWQSYSEGETEREMRCAKRAGYKRKMALRNTKKLKTLSDHSAANSASRL
jgi:hypothetical protein